MLVTTAVAGRVVGVAAARGPTVPWFPTTISRTVTARAILILPEVFPTDVSMTPCSPVTLTGTEAMPSTVPNPTINVAAIRGVLLSLVPDILPTTVEFASAYSGTTHTFQCVDKGTVASTTVARPFRIYAVLVSGLSDEGTPGKHLELGDEDEVGPTAIKKDAENVIEVPSDVPLRANFVFVADLTGGVPEGGTVAMTAGPIFDRVRGKLRFVSAEGSLVLV